MIFGGHIDCDRIIPARAGFTRHGRPVGERLRDHPRSRGVYPTGSPSPTVISGSSPLARGLRSYRLSSIQEAGIIPARAGFTITVWPPRSVVRDHPRSRGVYQPPLPLSMFSMGSSPLARGLRRRFRGQNGVRFPVGIIPARAGFTCTVFSVEHCDRDHPRSRGVYWCVHSSTCVGVGSSPLARGLPGVILARLGNMRIIPARAGFTMICVIVGVMMTDHPRSRGVYGTGKKVDEAGLGSSPLARGLRRPTPGRGPIFWIIPARAGFTYAGSGGPKTKRDHPRSRGVYPQHS